MKKYLILTILFSVASLSVMNFKVSAQTEGLISISPNSADLKINEEKIISLKLNSSPKISGFDLKFNTSGPLSIVDFVKDLGFGSAFDPFSTKQVMENISGSNSRVAYILTTPQANLPAIVTLFIKIKGASAGQGKITLDYNNSQILDGSGKPLQVTPLTAAFNLNPNQSSPDFIDPSQIPTPNYPESTAVVNLKVKLYGSDPNPKVSKIKAVAVAVGRIGEGKYETAPQPFDLIPNSDGTFSGTVAFPGFRDGNKFSLMLKVDKYLLRRVCKPQPSEDKVGGYRCQTPNLTIRKGEDNSFDFSKVSLIPGDLGLTDGYLNGYDLGIVRNNLGKSEAKSVNLADLNYDGVVDSKDFEIIQNIAVDTSRKADQ